MAQVIALAPALIILDLHLPHVSGGEILHQIRQDEKLAKAHVVVTTADSVQAAAVQDEADLVLIKPISVVHCATGPPHQKHPGLMRLRYLAQAARPIDIVVTHVRQMHRQQLPRHDADQR